MAEYFTASSSKSFNYSCQDDSKCSKKIPDETTHKMCDSPELHFVCVRPGGANCVQELVSPGTLQKGSPSLSEKELARAEDAKSASSMDVITYEHYRQCILEMSTPNTSAKFAAVQAVLFMSGKDEKIPLTLIDLALKFLWTKHGSCPSAVVLYSAICSSDYDERYFVHALIELCQVENGRPAVNLNSQASTDEPLRALDFKFPAPVSQSQNSYSDLQFHSEEEHINKTTGLNWLDSQKCNQITEKPQKKRTTEKEFYEIQVQLLEKEQEYLKASMMCVLCKIKQIEVTLLPCGHFVLCAACSENCNICPMCNKQALAEVKTYLC